MGQPWAAAAIGVANAVTARRLIKYGDRGYRYLLLEARHAKHNMALEFGTVHLGGFYDDELAGLLRIDTDTRSPLYATALGSPKESTPDGRRALDKLTETL
ncbi:nitroreductase family protein [Actinokineospora iranica]|uniref:Uncharacterized protein n=1 Tax=Actinokineospora iranica TaxID=1271860 RepID=A0A1G6ZF35_9PSEU|nr:hypothetical protein [Actinokineospora iranica]SDE01254.1 hypothetical protein SAMN05216174_1307 [Actinokineospora iranica]